MKNRHAQIQKKNMTLSYNPDFHFTEDTPEKLYRLHSANHESIRVFCGFCVLQLPCCPLQLQGWLVAFSKRAGVVWKSGHVGMAGHSYIPGYRDTVFQTGLPTNSST